MAVKDLVDDYIIKPFRLQTLQEKLDRALSTPVHGPQKIVVVADDDADARAMVIEYLQRFGFKRIQAFEDGQSALEFLKKNADQVWLVIADWEMPRMKGVELLSYCRAHKNLKAIPFFIINQPDFDGTNEVIQAAQSRVDHYLLKPFTQADLGERIDVIFQKRRIEKNIEETVEKGTKSFEGGHFRSAQRAYEKALRLDAECDLAMAGLETCCQSSRPWMPRSLTIRKP